ncbi:MAG: T9SS type A sorting domain-containing protein [Saprospiraceae bacterium]|nr:T9SS type A sorting domain-containing protein [Saprospiraceae bacterium]
MALPNPMYHALKTAIHRQISWVLGFDIAASGLPFIKYVKIIDRSLKESNRFNGLTDGFDVDGISCIQSRSGSPAQAPTASNNQGRTRNSDTGLLLYPNVVDNAFRISFREDMERSLPEELTVVIYNSAGQEVKRHTSKVIDEEIEIQMPAVGSGLYIVHAISDTEVRVAKILKQ